MKNFILYPGFSPPLRRCHVGYFSADRPWYTLYSTLFVKLAKETSLPHSAKMFYHCFILTLATADNSGEIENFLREEYVHAIRRFGIAPSSVSVSTVTSDTPASPVIEVRHSFDNRQTVDVFKENSSQLKALLHEKLVTTDMANSLSETSGDIMFTEHITNDRATSVNTRDKSKWPELKNRPLEEVRTIIAAERPDLALYEVPQGSMVTMDMRMDRVRIYHKNGQVSTIPKIG